MESDKFYKINNKKSSGDVLFVCVLFLLMVVLSFIGLKFLSFLLSTIFAFVAFRFYVRNKNKIKFFKLSEESNQIRFFNIEQKLIIEDTLNNFIFYKPKRSYFEIGHSKLKRNIWVNKGENSSLLLNFLKKNQNIKFKKSQGIGFWEVIELIFM